MHESTGLEPVVLVASEGQSRRRWGTARARVDSWHCQATRAMPIYEPNPTAGTVNYLHLVRNLVYSVILAVAITAVMFFLTFLASGFPTISPVDSHGCSLSHAYGFPIRFEFYNTPYSAQTGSCGPNFWSFDQTGLAADLAIWLVVAFLFLSLRSYGATSIPPQSPSAG
jgi:hypothetical protein